MTVNRAGRDCGVVISARGPAASFVAVSPVPELLVSLFVHMCCQQETDEGSSERCRASSFTDHFSLSRYFYFVWQNLVDIIFHMLLYHSKSSYLRRFVCSTAYIFAFSCIIFDLLLLSNRLCFRFLPYTTPRVHVGEKVSQFYCLLLNSVTCIALLINTNNYKMVKNHAFHMHMVCLKNSAHRATFS